MGPSIKFVSAIKDTIFNKKMGVNFFSGKKPNPGGGGRGRFGKRPQFSPFFNPSLISEDGYGDDGDGDENGEEGDGNWQC